MILASLLAAAALVTGALLCPTAVVAAGVVGTGTPTSCTEATLDAALAGGGTVTFDCGAAPVTITVTSTWTLIVDTSVDGGGMISISGGKRVAVFYVKAGVKFTVQNLVIANGNRVTGAGIRNEGTLTLVDSTVSANTASVSGGGILNYGRLTVANSTFEGNSAEDGGAIDNGSGGTLTVTNSVFGSNRADAGGAIINGGTATVSNSTFSGGGVVAFADGGAIFNDGTFTLTNSTFRDNHAFVDGGAIFNGGGTLRATNSTFSGNSAAHFGGAISNDHGYVTVTNSTFSGNIASSGGAIFNSNILTLTNNTFSGNDAGGCNEVFCGTGTAIHNGGTLTVINSTFSGNGSPEHLPYTIFNITGCGDQGIATCPAMLRNTIVANSVGGRNCSGSITDGGHNLDDGTSCGFSAANGSSSNSNPLLDPVGLADNGGPTQTIALEMDSPAISAGDESICANAPVNGIDQRGFVRPGVGHTVCSIGAYEADAAPAEACTGDCDGNGVVAINELILGVDIVLAIQPETDCPAFANSQGMVDIAQLITGVNKALNGCGG